MEANNILALIGIVFVVQAIVLIYYIFKAKKQEHKDESSVLDEKSWDIIHDSIRKSQAIEAQAELDSLKLNSQSEMRLKDFEKESEQKIAMTSDEVVQSIKEETARAGESYKKNLAEELAKFQSLREETEDQVRKSMEELVQRFDVDLSSSVNRIQDEVRKELEDYQKRKETLIDQNAEEIMERAVELYLGKKLDKKEQMQLVFEALERAKNEKKF